MSTATAFQGELMLAGWSETHNGGAKLIFWLPDASELDAFRALTVRKGNTAGQRFMAVLVQIGDDELPVPTEPGPLGRLPIGDHKQPRRMTTGQLAFQAVQYGENPAFRRWASLNFERPVDTPKDAADLIREVCLIDSRATLDRNTLAAERFSDAFAAPFSEWLKLNPTR